MLMKEGRGRMCKGTLAFIWENDLSTFFDNSSRTFSALWKKKHVILHLANY